MIKIHRAVSVPPFNTSNFTPKTVSIVSKTNTRKSLLIYRINYRFSRQFSIPKINIDTISWNAFNSKMSLMFKDKNIHNLYKLVVRSTVEYYRKDYQKVFIKIEQNKMHILTHHYKSLKKGDLEETNNPQVSTHMSIDRNLLKTHGV